MKSATNPRLHSAEHSKNLSVARRANGGQCLPEQRYLAANSLAFVQSDGPTRPQVEEKGSGCICAHLRASRRMNSAAFSPIITAGACVLPETMVGMIEASAMRN